MNPRSNVLVCIGCISQKPAFWDVRQARCFLKAVYGLLDVRSLFIWTGKICGVVPTISVACDLEAYFR